MFLSVCEDSSDVVLAGLSAAPKIIFEVHYPLWLWVLVGSVWQFDYTCVSSVHVWLVHIIICHFHVIHGPSMACGDGDWKLVCVFFCSRAVVTVRV